MSPFNANIPLPLGSIAGSGKLMPSGNSCTMCLRDSYVIAINKDSLSTILVHRKLTLIAKYKQGKLLTVKNAKQQLKLSFELG